MSDVEERIKSLEFRIQNIENQIQDLASNSNTRGKSSNGGRSVAVKCEKCKEPVNKIYTIIQDSNYGDYRTWVGKSVCSNCIDDMEVNEADFEVKEENPDLLQASQKKCAKCGNQLNASFEVNHKVPLHAGGNNHVSNLEALCRNCHGEETMLSHL